MKTKFGFFIMDIGNSWMVVGARDTIEGLIRECIYLLTTD